MLREKIDFYHVASEGKLYDRKRSEFDTFIQNKDG